MKTNWTARLRLGVCLVGATVMGSWAAPASADVVLTAQQMAISHSAFPVAEYPTRTASPGGLLRFEGGSDPIVGFQVCPVDTAGMASPYVPLIDYSAILRDDGSIDATLNRNGPYMVRVTRQSGAIESIDVSASAGRYTTCFGGAETAFPCPTAPHQFVGADVAGFDDGFTNRMVSNSLAQMVMQICNASMAAGGPIDVVIADHGCRGAFNINGVDNVSKDPADAANLALFCTLSGKISDLTLIACSAAAPNPGMPDDGHDFICMLSMCLGNVPVRGWETNVSVTNSAGTYVWSSANPVPFVKVPSPGSISLLFAAGIIAVRRNRR